MHEAQDHGKEFGYSWWLLLIVLVAWEAPEDSVLPELKLYMCEGVQYTNLWDLKDQQCLKDNKVFWVLFQSGLATAIHSRPCLSLAVYDKYKSLAAF